MYKYLETSGDFTEEISDAVGQQLTQPVEKEMKLMDQWLIGWLIQLIHSLVIELRLNIPSLFISFRL